MCPFLADFMDTKLNAVDELTIKRVRRSLNVIIELEEEKLGSESATLLAIKANHKTSISLSFTDNGALFLLILKFVAVQFYSTRFYPQILPVRRNIFGS